MLENLKSIVLIVSLIILIFCMIFSFIRSLKGPKIADRILAINMIGTQVIIIICVIAILFNEIGLVDVAMIYALFSFLAVVLFSRVFVGVYNEMIYKKGEHE